MSYRRAWAPVERLNLIGLSGLPGVVSHPAQGPDPRHDLPSPSHRCPLTHPAQLWAPSQHLHAHWQQCYPGAAGGPWEAPAAA